MPVMRSAANPRPATCFLCMTDISSVSPERRAGCGTSRPAGRRGTGRPERECRAPPRGVNQGFPERPRGETLGEKKPGGAGYFDVRIGPRDDRVEDETIPAQSIPWRRQKPGGDTARMTTIRTNPSPRTTQRVRPQSRVVIVDDHAIFRKGLRELIEQELALEVVGEAPDASSALACVQDHQPDLIIIDLSLKGGSGIELIKQIKALHPAARMLVSSFQD